MGKTLATMGSMPTLLLFLFLLESSSARHQLNGQAPNITSQPEDIMVSSDSFISVGSVTAKLVLPCVVTGDPTPTVTWYRGGTQVDSGSVFDDTLAINVTEGGGDDATGAGVLYHCQATNMLNNFPATVRSRDVNVTYTFFGGFINSTERTVDVSVVVGGVAALECDVRVSVPLPTIEWSDSAETAFTDEQLLEGGRYLYIPEVTTSHIGRTYNCQVGSNMAPTTYRLVEDLPADTFEEYKPIGDLIGRVGEELSFSYIASSHDGVNIREISMNCKYNPGNEATSTRGLIGTFTVPEPTEGVGVLNIQCTIFTPGAGTRIVNGTVAVFKPARITNPPHPPEGNNPLIDRERLVGGGRISYTCVGEGSPNIPSVTWYYNGGTVSLDGVTVNGNNLVIAAPQVRHSGIYQCFVSNTFNQEAYFDQRTWVLEVRQPIAPMVRPLTESIAGAVMDRYEGVLLVGELNAPDVRVVAMVESDPCPTVQWSFNGNDIANGDIYMISNPCTDPNSASPYEFTLTIANLTSATSGRYSAVFEHSFHDSTTLPDFLVTVPETVVVQELDLAFDGNTEPSCLISGSSATLTCMTTGYPGPNLPRPTIIFRKGNIEIVAGMPGFERVTRPYFDQIRINNVEMSDEGAYACEAFDGTTTVLPPTPLPPLTFCTLPMIVSKSSTPNPREGDELIIDCEVSGIPFPTVTWMKDGNAFSGEGSDDRIFVSENQDSGVSRVRINSAIIDDAGVYTCTASNYAGSTSDMLRIQVNEGESDTFFSTTVIIAIAAGAAGIVLVIVLIILLMICVYLCTKRFKTGSTDFQPYNVDLPSKSDYTDGRGNVDADSNDGEQPEAFNPEYQSLPVLRPSEPPPYKATPGYQHGAPLDGDDLEMIKYPPDSESFVTGVSPYSRQQDNGYRPSPDDFLSEDAQFV